MLVEQRRRPVVGTAPENGLSSNRIGEPASVSGPYAGWSTSTSSPCERVWSQE